MVSYNSDQLATINNRAFTQNAFAQLDTNLFDSVAAACPITDCHLELPPKDLLAHLLMKHRPGDSMQEIAAEWRTSYDLHVNKLKAGCNHVVAVMAYAGPSETFLSRPIGPDHLPLMLVLYVSDPELNQEQQYVLYLVCLESSNLISAHVNLLTKPHGLIVSGQRYLRNFLKPKPHMDNDELLQCNVDCLIYKARDVWRYCKNGISSQFQFEVVLSGKRGFYEQQHDPKESIWQAHEPTH